MKFSEMPYKRPDLDAVLAALEGFAAEIAAAQTKEEFLRLFESFEQHKRNVYTQRTLVEIRHTVDTRDAFYEQENDFFDENSPRIADKQLNVYRALLASDLRSALDGK